LSYIVNDGAANNVFAYLECSDFINSPGSNIVSYIGDEGNFQVVFTAEAVHIYIMNPALYDVPVTGINCGCILDTDLEDPGDGDGNGNFSPGSGSKANNGTNPFLSEISIAPNPFSDNVEIKLSNSKDQISGLQIYALDGRMISIDKGQWSREAATIRLDTHHLLPGVYTLVLEVNETRISQRILKLY